MIIQSTRVWTGECFEPAQIVMTQGQIQAVTPLGQDAADEDYGRMRIIPGMIDVHTHGAYGYDVSDGTKEGLLYWLRHIVEEGVTALLPTIVTEKQPVIDNALYCVRQVMDQKTAPVGAELLGIHLEGPFIDERYRGAQPKAAILNPSEALYDHFQQISGGHIRYMTLSPVKDDQCVLIQHAVSEGVVVSLGHSEASYEAAMEAMNAGVSSVTHLFNGMMPLHHRQPGLIGAALTRPDVFCEIIADGMHVHPAVIQILFACKGRDQVIMVTDALRVKHAGPLPSGGGPWTLGGQPIELSSQGLAYIKGTETIAGSTLSMNKGLKLLIETAHIDEASAIAACTLNPARCLHIQHRKGKIAAGYDADLVVLDDDYDVLQTYCRGKSML